LLSEVVPIPSLLLFSERLPNVPDLVSDIIRELKLFHLWNFSFLKLENVLVAQVLVKLSDTLIVLLADFGSSVKCFLGWSFSSHELFISRNILN